MRDWILKHKKLYFFIVGVIAFIAFSIITLFGAVRLASAATTDDGKQYVSIDEIVDWGQFGQYSDMVDDYKYITVLRNKTTGVYSVYLTKEGFVEGGSELEPVLRVSQLLMLYVTQDGVVSNVNDMSDSNLEWDILRNDYFNGNSSMEYIGTNYDFSGTAFSSVPSKNIRWGEPEVAFSMDAPYFVYDSVVVENRLYEEYTQIGLSVEDMYSQYAKKSKWKYNGIIENMVSDSNAEYFVELNLSIEVPTLAYLEQLYIGYKSPIYTSYADDIVENSRECMLDWYGDAKAPKHSYTVEMPWPVTPDSNGRFSIEFTLDELLTYIRYFNPDGKEIINDMPAPIQSLWISFAHIESLRGSVITHLDNQIIYGRFTHNEFCRGDYSLCLEVVPNENYYDMTESEFDEYFERIYKEAHDKYIKDMQDSIDEIQKELDGLQSINGAFGDLGASDVWSGFVSTVSGLSSMGSAVRGLAVLTGSVFAFLPFQISSFMSFTILAICVIAIIKAIRG